MKGTTKVHGKGIVIGGRPRAGPNVLRPTTNNIGSTVNNGENGFDDDYRMGPLVPNIKDKCFNFLLVNFQSKLDRNKHGTVRVVESGEYDASKRKENSVFKFGKSSTGCSNPNVQTYEDGNVQRNEPLDCELGGSPNFMVELSVAMEDIVCGIEWGPDADL
ncbi:hypothetical protein J1N35_010632 [Gossypium stocksii]|uniref:Uncharacterized protein n=1 Tax=Gossypium stocksii TaxID=47602 RepID=A0A9D3W0S5_9ROSI|nr:hypothetical protein J1N35_010632 [Gossypium stocksii]